ncbi:MAG: hypothetical protein KAG99_06025 [Bacteroidales bacterium]|nr:hypothetical protein [Bacteroidales bacterium]
MKKGLVNLIVITFFSTLLSAQSPQSFHYQALVKGLNGSVIADQDISLKISIVQDSLPGTIIYSEIHNDSTNRFGMVNVRVGNGTVQTGDFTNIDWGAGPYFLSVEVDPEGGNNYTLLSSSELMSVPYALYAEKTGDTTRWKKADNNVYYNEGQVGIGIDTVNSSAILEINSQNRGMLPPRLTIAQRDAIPNPAAGLLIYNTDDNCMNFYNGIAWMGFGQSPLQEFQCGGLLKDERDGKEYITLEIGSLCWMGENLNIGTKIDGTEDPSENGEVEKYCYDNIPARCNDYGGLYPWYEMMQYRPEEINRGICPLGWHLPSVHEWDTLVNYLGGTASAGPALKTEGASGFEAMLTGCRLQSGTFQNIDINGLYWSSTMIDTTKATFRYIDLNATGFYVADTGLTHGFAVRCVKDTTEGYIYYPTQANAGSDQDSACNPATLAGNSPEYGTGKWTIISGSDGYVYNTSNPTSQFLGTEDSTYTLEWSISNKYGETSDTVSITFLSSATVANAGSDQTGLTSRTITLQANEALSGNGLWLMVSGAGGILADSSDNESSFTGLADSTYLLTWTISAVCDTTIDTVSLNFAANALDCGDTLIDSRDNKQYATVQIGGQCWLQQCINIGALIELEFEQSDNDTIEKYCFSDLETNCDEYGALYQWDEAFEYDYFPGAQGICPTGWHIPLEAEWDSLVSQQGSEAVAGMKLKEEGTAHWINPGGTNESGFTAIGTGYRDGILKNSYGLKNDNIYWYKDEVNNLAYVFQLHANWDYIQHTVAFQKDFAVSVRCIRDDE